MAGSLPDCARQWAATFVYDEENRLTAVYNPGLSLNPLFQIGYDALGRRVTTVDWTATTSSKTECGCTGGTVWTRHIYGAGLTPLVVEEYSCNGTTLTRRGSSSGWVGPASLPAISPSRW